jgi:hypothetical protein
MRVPLSTHVTLRHQLTSPDGNGRLERDGLAPTLIMTAGLQLPKVSQAATDLYAVTRVMTSRSGEPCKEESITPPS